MALEFPTRAARHAAATFCTAFESRPPGLNFLPSGGVQLITNEIHPLGNFAIGFSEDEAESIAAELGTLNAPSCLMFVEGISDDTAYRIGEHGFLEREDIPAMEVDLDRLGETSLAQGYDFYRLSSSADAHAWSLALAEGYGLPKGVADYVSPVHVPIDDADNAKFQFFAASKDDEIAAVSMLARVEGLAGIYCVAVLPEHRNRGLGAYVTAEPLRIARELGEAVGVLQASTMGHPVYRRLGFVDTGVVPLLVRIPEQMP